MKNIYCQDFKARLFFNFVQFFISIFGPQLSPHILKKTSNNILSKKIIIKITSNYDSWPQKTYV